MSQIWMLLTVGCVALALGTGRADETARALLEAGSGAVTLWLTLLGTMTLWSGLMAILERTGDVARLGRFLRRVLTPLFGGVTDDEAWADMGMNLAANVMGLGNAATPAGIRAARRLSEMGEAGARALAMLLALNNSSLQWLPTTVIALRGAAGAAHPADIWQATLISSGVSTLTAAALMAAVNRMKGRR